MADESVIARFVALLSPSRLASGCIPWLGALSTNGHGRFWLGHRRVIIAHRFAYALAHGAAALQLAPNLGHRCDEASCQNPDHLIATTTATNTLEWVTRRETIGNPLRDTRGAQGRALALRSAARAGEDLERAARAGLPEVDRLLDRLPGL